MSTESGVMQRLAAVWEGLSKRRFICSEAAVESRGVVGGTLVGYFDVDNPGTLLGECGGHDFLIVEDRWIIDFWAAAYYGERPIWDLSDPQHAADIRRLYGLRERWIPWET